MPKRLRIDITPSESVTALAYPAATGRCAGICLLLAHGAGANQESPFMVGFARELAARGIDTVTFNFLYSEDRRRIPDRTEKLETCFRRVIQAVRETKVGKDCSILAIGGKSMGGRIASHIASQGSDKSEGIAGLVFLGYPLHSPGRPDKLRSKHLPNIKIPMLFIQGSRDAFGAPEELRPVLRSLKEKAELFVVEGGDHSFKVPKRSLPSQDEVDTAVLDQVEQWLRGLTQNPVKR